MNIKQIILHLAESKEKISTKDIVVALKKEYSRQYISRLLNQLVNDGMLARIGRTTNTIYVLPKKKNEIQETIGNKIKLRLKNINLKEHEVLSEINSRLFFIINADENVRSIFDYAFSEMVNNAIEHSQTEFIEIEVGKEDNSFYFTVNDFGIGAFKNIMRKRKLNSELEAIQDLLKGKTTTEPHAHSGEGIFFTSKIADEFILDSFDYRLRIANQIPDVFIEKLKPIKRGTKVSFRISLHSKKHLSDLFKKFTSNTDDPSFDKTKIQVKLYTMGTIYVSRSQARRILSGLEKFKLLILDYDKVPTIGQAFADEIYRIFSQKHPDIKIESTNTNEAVKFMIDRTMNTK